MSTTDFKAPHFLAGNDESDLTNLLAITDVQPRSSVAEAKPRLSEVKASTQEVKIPTVDMSKETMQTLVAEGDEFVGNFVCKNGIRICGIVRGSVKASGGTVFVDKTGHVTGSVEGCGNVFVDGRVGEEGSSENSVKVITPGNLFLLDSAVVNADVEYGKLATYGDMTVNGTMRKITNS